MKIVRLRFSAGLHIGADSGGIGKENVQNIIHSDTIFSMLINSFADIAAGDENKINAFIQSINTLSSGFLFKKLRGRGNYEYYLPVPLNNPPDFSGGTGEIRRLKYGKALKKASFITLDHFQNWINGEELGISALKSLEERKYSSLYAIRIRPHHARDRLTSTTHLYHAGEMFFDKNAGIYFLISGQIEDSNLDAVLTNAAIKGLGGRRSHGKGIFEFSINPLDENWEKLLNGKDDNYVIISLYSPYADEIQTLEPAAYSLVLRKGWTFSSMLHGQFKRKTCRMFGEGSVFINKPEGSTVDVTPDPVNSFPHRFYRFGKAFAIPCAAMEKNYE